MRETASPMAATTKPASTPTSSASTMTLDSRARTMARKRCGTSNGVGNQRMEKDRVGPEGAPLLRSQAGA